MSEDVHVASSRGVKDTLDRFEAAVRDKGMSVFARIDHAAGAHAVGLELRPTELLIFGDARVGTKLMQAAQTMGIELPLKALAWEDAAGKTWLTFADPRAAAARQHVASETEPVTSKMVAALSELVRHATA